MSVSNEPYDFDEQKAFGLKWEHRVADRLDSLLQSISVKNIAFEDNPRLQLSGVDAVLEKERPEFDVKVQAHEYIETGNLPIEVKSDVEQGKIGWFYMSNSDMVVWVYPNKAKDNLYHRGYFMMLNDGIKEWFNERREQDPKKPVPNELWTTMIRLVPIEDFPDEYLVEFDPRLPSDRDTPQSDLEKWGGDG